MGRCCVVMTHSDVCGSVDSAVFGAFYCLGMKLVDPRVLSLLVFWFFGSGTGEKLLMAMPKMVFFPDPCWFLGCYFWDFFVGRYWYLALFCCCIDWKDIGVCSGFGPLFCVCIISVQFFMGHDWAAPCFFYFGPILFNFWQGSVLARSCWATWLLARDKGWCFFGPASLFLATCCGLLIMGPIFFSSGIIGKKHSIFGPVISFGPYTLLGRWLARFVGRCKERLGSVSGENWWQKSWAYLFMVQYFSWAFILLKGESFVICEMDCWAVTDHLFPRLYILTSVQYVWRKQEGLGFSIFGPLSSL